MADVAAGRTRIIPLTSNFNVATASPATNSVLTFQFPQSQAFQKCEVALSNLNVYYSWYNIQASYGNNTFSYTWPVGAGVNTFSVTVPDGSYQIADLNNYLQYAMQQNGTYLLDGTTPVFYLSFLANTVYYRVTVTSTNVPTSLPTGYSLPSNYPGALPTASSAPKLVIAAPGSSMRSSFSEVLGFAAGSYPASAGSVNGAYPPEIDPVDQVNVTCSLANNGLISQYPNVIYSFTPLVTFGNQISVVPPQRDFFPVVDGKQQTITVTLTDQLGFPLAMQDPTWNCTLLVRQL